MKIYAQGNILDINIVNGYPELVPLPESNNVRQRAAIAAYIQSSSIPGIEDFGANWASYVAQQSSLIEIDNQVKQCIASVIGEESPTAATIFPMYLPNNKGGLSLDVLQLDAVEVADA